MYRKLATLGLCAALVTVPVISASAEDTGSYQLPSQQSISKLTLPEKDFDIPNLVNHTAARISTPATGKYSYTYSRKSKGRIEAGEGDLAVFDADDFVGIENELKALSTANKDFQVKLDSHAKADNTGSHTFNFTGSGTNWSSSWQNDLFKNAINVQIFYADPDNVNMDPKYEVNTTTGTLTIRAANNPGSVNVSNITVLHMVDETTIN